MIYAGFLPSLRSRNLLPTSNTCNRLVKINKNMYLIVYGFSIYLVEFNDFEYLVF